MKTEHKLCCFPVITFPESPLAEMTLVFIKGCSKAKPTDTAHSSITGARWEVAEVRFSFSTLTFSILSSYKILYILNLCACLSSVSSSTMQDPEHKNQQGIANTYHGA
jgi:hypothetical protein